MAIGRGWRAVVSSPSACIIHRKPSFRATSQAEEASEDGQTLGNLSSGWFPDGKKHVVTFGMLFSHFHMTFRASNSHLKYHFFSQDSVYIGLVMSLRSTQPMLVSDKLLFNLNTQIIPRGTFANVQH